MATSNHLPPIPPVSSKAKDYSTDRPVEVTDELDELRTRGIAKVLNRHFTSTTKQLAKEKAEADAALADLERRRAQTSEFKPSKGGEGLNPFDSMYVQLQQRRAECRRKERETMLLYQRYVMKYGKSAKSVTPVKRMPTPTSNKSGGATPLMTALKEEDEDAHPGNNNDPPGVDISPDVGSPPSACKLEEQREQSTKQFLSALTKFLSDEAKNVSPSEAPLANEGGGGNDENIIMITSQSVPTSEMLTQQTTKDSISPSQAEKSTPKVNLFMSAVSNFMYAPASEEVVEETKMEDKGDVIDIDATMHIEGGVNGDDETQKAEGGDTSCDKNEMKLSSEGQVQPPSNGQDMIVENVDDQKVREVAPATTSTVQPKIDDGNLIEAAVKTPSVGETIQMDGPLEEDTPPVEVEREEVIDDIQGSALASDRRQKFLDPPETISKPASDEKQTLPPTPIRHESTDVATVTPLSSSEGVTNETPSFTTTTVDEGDDGDDRSIISGLTFNSVVTRQVMDEIETEMEDFIRTETAAIRRMLDSQEEQSTTISTDYDGDNPNDSLSSQIGDESVRVALKAEAMALEMQRILDEFEKEDNASDTVDEGTDLVDESGTVVTNSSSVARNKYPYLFEPTIPGAEWYVYFDDNYKREFYLEKKSNQTQWDPPNSVPCSKDDQTVVTSDDFLSDIQSVASGRGSLSRRSSRRNLYRKQRRKRRMRRLVVSFLALLCVLTSVFHWRVNHPEKTFSAAMRTTVAATLASLESNIDLEMAKTYLLDQFEYTFTDRRAREDADLAKIVANAKARQEYQAAIKAKEEADRKARLEEEEERRATENDLKEEALRQEQARQQEAIRQEEIRRTAELEVKVKMEIEKKKEPVDQRPWGCNIPFSFIHPKCNRILKVKPVYDDDFMVFLQ